MPVKIWVDGQGTLMSKCSEINFKAPLPPGLDRVKNVGCTLAAWMRDLFMHERSQEFFRGTHTCQLFFEGEGVPQGNLKI